MTADLKNEAQKALDAYDKYESHRDALQFAAAIESLRKAVELQAPAEGDAARRGLLPCPFCGRRPVLTVRPDNADATSYFAAVACFCDGYAACAHKDATASEADEAERLAREKWNGRAAHPQPKSTERAHPYGRCTITGPAEDVAFIFRHLPDVDDTQAPAPAPEVPAGMVLVPITPTPDMIAAGGAAAKNGGCDLYGMRREAINAYAAMLAAAPVVPCAAVGAEPVRYPHPDEDDPVTLWKEIRRLRAAMSQAKCDCTAYCGQYVLHGSCRAHPAPVTISHVPVQGSES